MLAFIGGSNANEITNFDERIADVHQNARLQKLEYYESDGDEEGGDELKRHEKEWNIMDGMTSAINTESKASVDDDGMESFQNKKM